MSQWARLHVETSESEDIAALQAKDPNAALLFLMGMPHAMPWGVLPGAPALFRAKVCPLFDVSLSTVETCLRLIIDSGMMIGYTDSRGKPLVYYAAWNRYQGSQQWSRVGPPPHDLPPDWEPPANIAQALRDAAREKRPLTADAIEARLLTAESKTRLRLVLEESCLRSKKSESEEETTKAQQPSPKPAAPAAPVTLPIELTLQSPPGPEHDPPKEEPPADDTPATVTLTPTQEAIERLWAAFGFTLPMGNESKLSKSGKPSTEGYSGLVKIIDAKGLPIVSEYTAWVNRTRPQLPAGSNRWVWFLDQFRGAMSRPWEWRNGHKPQMGPRPVGDWSAPDATRAPRQD